MKRFLMLVAPVDPTLTTRQRDRLAELFPAAYAA